MHRPPSKISTPGPAGASIADNEPGLGRVGGCRSQLLITGPTGVGKSWFACALAQYACRRGYSALYQRVPGCGRTVHPAWQRGVRQMAASIGQDRRGRLGRLGHGGHRQRPSPTCWKSLTTAAGASHHHYKTTADRAWHAWIGDATIADAMLDRLMQHHHRITLAGESLRKSAQKAGITLKAGDAA